ncbi:MAG: PDZ domain-containing protein, partial [Opitutaceae bacterium]
MAGSLIRFRRGVSLSAIGILAFADLPVALAAESASATEPAATADNDPANNDDIISLAGYNAKADRIEDFGIRVESSFYSKPPKTTAGFFLLAKFVPIITAVVPNTAAAKAGLRPGDRILKSEGQVTVGGAFSTGRLGKWYKIQKKKWAEVAAGKKNVTWTLEIETPATKKVRTVKLVVPTPPPHWGASIWRAPEGR